MVNGEVYLGVVSNGQLTGGLFPIGNVSKLSLGVTEDTKELLDYTSAGGGIQNKIIRIKSVEASMSLSDIGPENIALAVRGSSTAIIAAAVSNETKTAYKGGLVVFDFLPDWTQTSSVKDNAGAVTYVEGTDYIKKNNGVLITANSAIANAANIKVSYTKKASHAIEGLINAGLDYRLVFNGLNEAQSGKPFSVTLYRVKFSPTSGLDFIGDDFNKIEVKGAVIQDSSIIGNGISQYFKAQMAD